MAYRLLVGIFMCLMLPFASFLLFGSVRRKLGARKVIGILILLLAVIPVVLAVIVPPLLESPYVRFTEKNQKYYAKIAKACDSLLQPHAIFYKHSDSLSQQHPKTYLLWMDTNNVIRDRMTISAQDPRLPKIIRHLHPYQIFIAPNYVCVWVGGPRPDYTINWGPDETKTNTWTLSAGGEGVWESLYSEKR